MSDFDGFPDEVLHALNVVQEINLRISNLEEQIRDIKRTLRGNMTMHEAAFQESRVANMEAEIMQLKCILELTVSKSSE